MNDTHVCSAACLIVIVTYHISTCAASVIHRAVYFAVSIERVSVQFVQCYAVVQVTSKR